MMTKYDPRSGLAYWGEFEEKFPEIEQILRKEFGLVSAWIPNQPCLVSEENGMGLWRVHFRKNGEFCGQKVSCAISFKYWQNRATNLDFERDPMRHAAEKVYSIIKPKIRLISTSSLDTPIYIPWA